MVFAFVAFKKNKANWKVASHVQIRKYKDAILWGASQAKQFLPSLYYNEMQSFLQSFKKEMAAAKAESQLDKQEADPISPTFFAIFSIGQLRHRISLCGSFCCASGTSWHNQSTLVPWLCTISV